MSGDARLRRWQRATLAALTIGYTGYYLCRSNFSVALPLIAAELAAGGLDADLARIRLGEVASLGVLAYAFGKFASGFLAERFGGRRSFLAGMALSAVCTLGFAASGTLPLFSLAWIANRSAQSAGWTGIVKLVSRWFPSTGYGGAMAVVSLSFLFGDAAARAALGFLLARGATWRQLFAAAAAGGVAILVACAAVLREAPRERGALEPPLPPDTLGGEAPGGLTAGPWAVARALLASRSFRWICLVSLGLTLLRETFNTWTPTYFTDAIGLAPGAAAQASAVFPILGGISVLLAGVLANRLGPGGRAAIVTFGVALAVMSLAGLAGIDPARRPVTSVALVALTGFLLIGPYSYLAGAISLDFGGRRGSAVAAGIVDGVGYLGAVLAGGGVARLASRFGWSGAFLALAFVALATAAAAGGYFVERRRASFPAALAPRERNNQPVS